MEYKDTLNLPKTDFPMKANLPNREPDVLKSWAQHSIFQKVLDQSKKSKRYTRHGTAASGTAASGRVHMFDCFIFLNFLFLFLCLDLFS